MQNLKWILILLVGMSLGTITAQETLEEGTIKYEITDASSDNPQIQQQLGMYEGSTMTVFIMGNTQLTKMNMMNGMMQQRMLMDLEKDSMEMYMDAAGRKIKTVMSISEDDMEQKVETNIEYYPDDKKEIIGYNTYKAVIVNKMGSQEMEMTAYITDELQTKANLIRNMKGTDQLKGLPLEYTVSQPQISMTFTVTELSKDVDPSEFDFDKTGYKEMSPEELQQLGGGGF